MNHFRDAEKCDDALPRDISRFKRLYPNGRAIITDHVNTPLAYLSTAELVNEAAKPSA